MFHALVHALSVKLHFPAFDSLLFYIIKLGIQDPLKMIFLDLSFAFLTFLLHTADNEFFMIVMSTVAPTVVFESFSTNNATSIHQTLHLFSPEDGLIECCATFLPQSIFNTFFTPELHTISSRHGYYRCDCTRQLRCDIEFLLIFVQKRSSCI